MPLPHRMYRNHSISSLLLSFLQRCVVFLYLYFRKSINVDFSKHINIAICSVEDIIHNWWLYPFERCKRYSSMLAFPNPFCTSHAYAWAISAVGAELMRAYRSFIRIHVLIAHVLCNVFNVNAHVYVSAVSGFFFFYIHLQCLYIFVYVGMLLVAACCYFDSVARWTITSRVQRVFRLTELFVSFSHEHDPGGRANVVVHHTHQSPLMCSKWM